MITASQLDRILACPASVTLPQHDVENEWRDRGVALHKYLENASTMGEGEALAMVPEEYRDACRYLVLDDLPSDAQHEVAYAFDVSRGEARQLHGCKERSYGDFDPGAFEVFGTADVVYQLDDVVVVQDYKTAWGKRMEPRNSMAMMFYGLCAWKVAGEPSKVRLVFQNVDAGSTYTSEVDAFDLLPFAEKLRSMYLAPPTGGEPKEGEHCRYCPAQESCPAKLRLAASMVNGSLDREIELSWAGGLTRETAADAYRMYKKMDMLLRRARDIIYAYASQQPIELGGGRVFGKRETRGREKLDAQVVTNILRREFGEPVAELATTQKVTKRDMELAIRSAVPRGAAAGQIRRILKLIRDEGGSEQKSSTKIDEYEVKR